MTEVWRVQRTPAAPEVRAAIAGPARAWLDARAPDPTTSQRQLIKAATVGASLLLIGPRGSGRLTASALALAQAAQSGDAVAVVPDAERARRLDAALAELGASGVRVMATPPRASVEGLLVLDDLHAARPERARARRVLLLAEPEAGLEAWVADSVETADGRCGSFDATPYGAMRLRVWAPIRNRYLPDDAASALDRLAAEGARSVAETPGELVVASSPRSTSAWARAAAATGGVDKEDCAAAVLAYDGWTALVALVASARARRGALDVTPAAGWSASIVADVADVVRRLAELAAGDADSEVAAYAAVTELFSNRALAKAAVRLSCEIAAAGDDRALAPGVARRFVAGETGWLHVLWGEARQIEPGAPLEPYSSGPAGALYRCAAGASGVDIERALGVEVAWNDDGDVTPPIARVALSRAAAGLDRPPQGA
ncbi:MAG: hypothetical protein H6698_04840 [Myxococcales bacterium]|nr:hypothetical protein [Myxococcales bacterium]MCB9533628.1 hypothetical protein [Myxococcales bacterium]